MSEAPPKITLWKLLLPVAIGLGATAYLMWKADFNFSALTSAPFSKSRLVIGLLLGVLAVLSRDLAFMYKLRLSTGSKMTWLKTFQTITMWEFCACISPKVAEAPFVLYVLKNSGLTAGKTIAVYMLNAFFDNVAFVVMLSLLVLVLGNHLLDFTHQDCGYLVGHEVMQKIRDFAHLVWYGYGVIFCAVIFLGVALFILPHATKRFFHRLSVLPVLSRFKESIATLGDEVEITAHEFRNMPLGFWVKMTVATFVNWISRYLLALALLYAFSIVNFDFVIALSRQYALWIFTGIPSTPGATGVAEVSFIALNCEFMPFSYDVALAIALVWRLYSYYLYLLLGLIVLPKWSKQIAQR